MHITASVFVNDDEYGLHQDYEKRLEALAPDAPFSQYQHNRFEGSIVVEVVIPTSLHVGRESTWSSSSPG